MDLLTPARDSKEKLPLYYMQIKQLDTFSMGIVTRLQDEGTNKGSYRVCSNNYLYYRHPSRKKQNFMICAELGAESATCSVQCFISWYCNHLIVMLIIWFISLKEYKIFKKLTHHKLNYYYFLFCRKTFFPFFVNQFCSREIPFTGTLLLWLQQTLLRYAERLQKNWLQLSRKNILFR